MRKKFNYLKFIGFGFFNGSDNKKGLVDSSKNVEVNKNEDKKHK